MDFRVTGLDPEPFRPLFQLDERELALLGARRLIADEPNAFPCRVSLEDAETLAKNLGIRFLVQPIEPMFQSILEALRHTFAGLPFDVIEENLHERVRGTLLMALSNK